MDLNAFPSPEEDEYEQTVDFNVPDETADGDHEEHVKEEHEEPAESAVQTLRREREERRQRLKREYQDDVTHRPTQIQRTNEAFYSRNVRSSSKSKLPSGWLDCPGAGDPLGYIIPSKVPLGESFNDVVLPGKRYSLRQVTHQQRLMQREIGLIIDLTNTTRYYPASDWMKQGIKHCKIPCKGRDEVPDNLSVNIFFYEVQQFLLRFKSQGRKYILVHCTHGHNRTGFMIVHYLVRYEGLAVSEAVQRFACARPPGIYKPDYLDALYTFYHEKRPEFITCPPTPEWKRSSEIDLNGEVLPDDDYDNGIVSAPHEVSAGNGLMTNDDVLGDEISRGQQTDLQRYCCQKLGVAGGNLHFPGSQPVSLDRANLQLLRQRYYYATWKADGTRYMMLITYDGCYLIDRKFIFRRIQMRFPLKSQHQDERRTHHHMTLLDGEMVIDTVPETGQLARRYLVYDMMMLNNDPIIKLPFYERWKLVEKEVIGPRNTERQVPSSYRYEMEPFRMRRKAFWMLSTVVKLLSEFIPSLSHEADGLIFQGWDDPYVPRTHEGLLKWKYAHMNSVDFLLEVAEDGDYALYLFDQGRKKKLDGARVVFQEDVNMMDYSGKIVECSWKPDEAVWVYLRIRVDKETPNAWKTYHKVMQSIKDNITEGDLLSEIDEIIRLPMYAERIAKESQAHLHHAHNARRK